MPGLFFWGLCVTRPVWLFLLLLVVGCVAYWPGLSGPLVFDDHQNLAPLTEWLAGNTSGWRVVLDNASGLLGRQVSMASLVLNIQLLGPGIWGLKLGNLVIHLINGLLVYLLLTRLSRVGAPVQGMHAMALRWAPCIVAGIWLLHPLQVSTTLYVIQRMAMLSTLFTLATLILYISAREALTAGRQLRALTLFSSAGACVLLAVFSKENGVLAPALCALIEWWVFAPATGKRRHPLSWAVIAIGLVAPALVALALTLTQSPFIVSEYANRPFTLSERLMTQGRVLWDYMGALVLPYGPRLGLYHDDYTISRGWLTPASTLLAWLGWVAALVAAIRLRTRVPGVGLGLGFYLIAQALESSVFPLLMYFEHRAYLPSAGALWALASLAIWGGQCLSRRMDHPQKIFTLGIFAFLVALALATHARAQVWQSQQALLTQGLKYHPHSRWLRVDVAQAFMQANPPDPAEALRHIDALAGSDQESTRRLSGIWRLLIECSTSGQADPRSKKAAFAGHMQDLEADLLVSIEALADGVEKTPCRGLGRQDMARDLVTLANQALVPQNHANLRRLRFKAAQLYLRDGDPQNAIVQARAAYSRPASEAPIAALLAQLELAYGDRIEGLRIISDLERQIPSDDLTGRQVLLQLQQQAAARSARP